MDQSDPGTNDAPHTSSASDAPDSLDSAEMPESSGAAPSPGTPEAPGTPEVPGTVESGAPTVDPVALAELVQRWLPTQRFFAGKQRPMESLSTRLLGRIGPTGAEVEIWLAMVEYVDGGEEMYQVPLHLSPVDYDGQAHARLGDVAGAQGSRLNVYDAMTGRHLTQAFLQGIVDEQSSGALRFHLSAAPADIPLGDTSIVLSGEQSNTSAVFGDKAILKLFRRLDGGVNPDIEIHEALTDADGSHIARLLGYISADLGGGNELASLAMLQDFLNTGTDGWVLATASVRDLMAEADLHAEEAGGDFAGEAYRLGRATAEVHAALSTAFPTAQLDAAQMRERADAMIARLDDALELVAELRDVADALRASYEALATSEPMTVQRIHGDLHLGQVLRTVNRWVVLDFEGEPAKSIAERRRLFSPLRDVAGMLRSFDYAANHQAIDTSIDAQRQYRAIEWSERNRDAFCAGYAKSGPDPREQQTLLYAFEADKAVYEAVYEARNRPAWLAVPLASLGRLAELSTAHRSGAPASVARDAADREESR